MSKITNYFSRKRSLELASDDNDAGSSSSSQTLECSENMASSKSAKSKVNYRSRLSYRKEWEKLYPWVYCNTPEAGMFCHICQKFGKPPATARGGWTSRGITDWNHATEILKNHNDSNWHRDGAIAARMSEQAQHTGTVLDLHLAASAKQVEEERQRNRSVLLKLLRSTYYLAKHRFPYTTSFKDLIELQIENGDSLLKQHTEGPSNAQYTSKFSSVSMIEAISKWIDGNLEESLKSSSFFSILADECVDVTTHEELSLCCRWVVNGRSEEHFMTILHITSLTSESIAAVITSFLESKGLDYRKLIGQGYDGAATFAGKNIGVQKRMRTLSGHALYIHCSCHRLQLASIQAAETIPWIQKMFGMMANLWKLFYYSPKKAEKLKEIQYVLNYPELEAQ